MNRPRRVTRQPQKLVMSFSDEVEKYELEPVGKLTDHEELFDGIDDDDDEEHSVDDKLSDDDEFIERGIDTGNEEYTPDLTIDTDGDYSGPDSDSDIDDS